VPLWLRRPIRRLEAEPGKGRPPRFRTRRSPAEQRLELRASSGGQSAADLRCRVICRREKQPRREVVARVCPWSARQGLTR
jgi:hypothetical protein